MSSDQARLWQRAGGVAASLVLGMWAGTAQLCAGHGVFVTVQRAAGFVWSGVFIWSTGDWKRLERGAAH